MPKSGAPCTFAPRRSSTPSLVTSRGSSIAKYVDDDRSRSRRAVGRADGVVAGRCRPHVVGEDRLDRGVDEVARSFDGAVRGRLAAKSVRRRSGRSGPSRGVRSGLGDALNRGVLVLRGHAWKSASREGERDFGRGCSKDMAHGTARVSHGRATAGPGEEHEQGPGAPAGCGVP